MEKTDSNSNNSIKPSADKTSSADGVYFADKTQSDFMQENINSDKEHIKVKAEQEEIIVDKRNVDSSLCVSEKVTALVSTPPSSDDEKRKPSAKPKKKRNLWAIKITLISLVLSAFISFLSELTASSEHIIVTVLLLAFLILASILFDAIGIAVTSCDITPIISMSSRKIYGAKTAQWLLKNNEKVASVCNDVIGDIFGIISGACSAAIVLKIIAGLNESWQQWLAIAMSSVVSALTIGGKAFMKNIAMRNSREFVMFVARILAVFSKEERKRRKKEVASRNQDKEKTSNHTNSALNGSISKSGNAKENKNSNSKSSVKNAPKSSKKTAVTKDSHDGFDTSHRDDK